MAAVQDITQIMAELDPAYAQSRNLYTQQMGGLEGAEQADLAALEGAKTRGFTDIARGANSRGLDFFGTPIEEQNRYLAEKFLPGVAARKSQTAQSRMTLQQAIASLEQDRYKTALGRQDQQKQQVEEERRLAEERAWKEQQASLDRAASASSRAEDNIDLEIRKDSKTGGYTVYENGKKSTNYDLNAYARATGKNIVDLLRNGDAKDKQAVKWYEEKIKKYGNRDQAKYLEELKRDRMSAFYLGG